MYNEGDRIWLKANDGEGWPRQEVIVVGVDEPTQTMVVQPIETEGQPTDDIMEVGFDQVEN
jgi:hypothetical protein